MTAPRRRWSAFSLRTLFVVVAIPPTRPDGRHTIVGHSAAAAGSAVPPVGYDDHMAESPLKSRRRWFRFGLRTLFVVVTILACWLGYSFNWISGRQAARRWLSENADDWNETRWLRPNWRFPETSAPGFLWIFGEEGEYQIHVPKNTPDARIERLKMLFPETSVARKGY